MITSSSLQLGIDQDPFMLAEDFDEQSNGPSDESYELSQDDESLELRSHSIITQEKSSLSSHLARYWHSAHLLNRLAWWKIKHKPDEETPTRLFWLRGEGVPLDDWSKVQWANGIKNFIDSTGFMLLDVGSAVMLPLLLHDWMSYDLFPEERCGSSWPAILSGTATNQITWTNHFGSDVIHEAAYWTWLGVLLIPPMVGLNSLFLHKKQLRRLDTEKVRDMVEDALYILDKESLTFKEACLSLFPMSRLSETLTQVKCILLWDGRKDKDNEQNLLISLHLKHVLTNTLIELTESDYFLIRYRAIRLLTQMAASFHPENLDRFIEDPVHKEGLVQLRESILAALKKEPINEASTRQSLNELAAACEQPLSFEEMENVALLEDRQRGGMARYFRWTLGDDTRLLTQLFWIPTLIISIYKLYSLILYLKLMVNKLTDIAYYFYDKSGCEDKSNYFKFLTQSERYECVACDWPFVSYQNSFTPETCLENLLQQKMTSMELRHYLNQLPLVRGITRIDLSQQDWSNWLVSDWEKFLFDLGRKVISPLELFNASGMTEEINRISSAQHIQALAQLLTQINVTQFDISHNSLTDELFLILLDSLAYQPLNALYLLNTNMTDVSATYLSELISSNFNNLSALHLSNNRIGDSGITSISQALPNSSLQLLNVAENIFSDLGLKSLGLGIQQSEVQSLDLSDQLLSVHGLRLFSDALKENSSLHSLKLSHVGLTNDHLAVLQHCLTNLESLDVSDNVLTGKAIQFILNASQHLKTFFGNNNDVDQETISLIAHIIPTTSLQHLDLSNNDLRTGFNDLVNVLPNSQLLSLVCEACDLEDKDVSALTAVFSNTTLRLQSLNLNKNQITDASLLNWLAVLPQTSLRELHLNNNEISSANESASLLAQGLAETHLTMLDLSYNRLDKHFFNELGPLLHQSSLQQLGLSDNKLETASLNSFSKTLVQLPCHSQDLNAPHLSRQEKRVFYPMKRNTNLYRLNIINTDPDSSTLRGFCRVSASLPDIQFLEPEYLQHLDWRSCDLLAIESKPLAPLERTPESAVNNQTRSMQSAALLSGSPFLISLLCAGGILCVIALLYGTYRVSRSTYRFFRPEPRIPRLEPEEDTAHLNLRHPSF